MAGRKIRRSDQSGRISAKHKNKAAIAICCCAAAAIIALILFLFVFGEAFIKKINRIIVKYGILEESQNEQSIAQN